MKIIECPRDAMQGMKEFISTEMKTAYINQLLKVGFDTIDFGSFVSPKAIPQMRDTAEVLKNLDLSNTSSRLLAIIANTRGAQDAIQFNEIDYLGFPFSISETFQQRNANSTIEQSLLTVEEIQNLCIKNNKKLVVYISMAFGNPYGDIWNSDIAIQWTEKLVKKLDIKVIALSDTIGCATPSSIDTLFKELLPEFKTTEIGAHFHTTPETWEEKVNAAYQSGCRRFDGAIKGFGGCPMAKDDLTGNMPTEKLIEFMQSNHIDHTLNLSAFNHSFEMAQEVFSL
jgi:hydroxymethylglutaryl-CoA lyase